MAKADAKKARRKKRRAKRDASWIPDSAQEKLSEQIDEVVSALEEFDARLTERGWAFDTGADDDDVDDLGVLWYWPPSVVEPDDTEGSMTATVAALVEDEGGEIVHVVFVGTDDDYQFDLEELFDYLDLIEAYRIGDALPAFD